MATKRRTLEQWQELVDKQVETDIPHQIQE